MFRELLTRVPDIARHRAAAAAAVDVHQRHQAPAGGVHARRGAVMDYPEVPVGALLAGSARRFGDRTAMHYYGRELTFAQLHDAGAGVRAGAGRGRDRARRRRRAAPAELPAVPDRVLRHPAGRRHLLAHQPAAPARRPRRAARRLRRRRRRDMGTCRTGTRRRAAPHRDPARAGHRPRAGARPGAPGRHSTHYRGAGLRGLPRRRPAVPPASRSTCTRPRPPRLHRRHHRAVQGCAAAAPQRRGQHAAVGMLGHRLRAGPRRRTAGWCSTRWRRRRSSRCGSARVSRSTSPRGSTPWARSAG